MYIYNVSGNSQGDLANMALHHSTRHFTEGALHCNTVWDRMMAPRLKITFQPSLGSQSLPPKSCLC